MMKVSEYPLNTPLICRFQYPGVVPSDKKPTRDQIYIINRLYLSDNGGYVFFERGHFGLEIPSWFRAWAPVEDLDIAWEVMDTTALKPGIAIGKVDPNRYGTNSYDYPIKETKGL